MCYLIVFFLFCVDWNSVLLFGLKGFFIIISGVTPLFSFHAVYKRCFFHLIVPGASNFCVACGHGGHTYHLMTWFETMEVCPSGCGCRCLEVGTFIVDWLFLLHKGVKLRERHCRDHICTWVGEDWHSAAQCAARGSSQYSVETVQNGRTTDLLWTHKRQLYLARQGRSGVAGRVRLHETSF